MAAVKVDIVRSNPLGEPVTTQFSYDSMVTLSIEAADGSLTARYVKLSQYN